MDDRWVVIAALVVLGIYAYRRLTEAVSTSGISVKGALGLANPLPVSSFITAWGFVFFVIALMAAVDPKLGGAFAVLVMTTDFLTNAPALFKQGSKLSGEQQAAQAEVGQAPGFFDTPTGPGIYKPPPGVKVVG